MTIKQHGGVFGRNPEFNDVTTENVVVSGDLEVSDKIIHSGDTNTSVRFPAADTVTVETAGLERLRVASGGFVSVGPIAPQVNFHLSSSAGNTAARIQSVAGAPSLEFVSTPGMQRIRAGIGGSNNMLFETNSLERARFDASGNLLIGGSTTPASAQKSLALFNGVAPSGSVTDGVVLYAEDVSASSELKVRDEAGNVTTLSPHNFELIPEGPSEEMAWSYYSERDGKRINVDMLKAVRLLEKITGEQLVHIA